MFPGANGVPDPATRQPFVADARRTRSTSRSAPAATCSTSTSSGGTIRRILPSSATARRPPSRPPRPRAARAAARQLRRHRLQRPRRRHARRYAWDLDGDGAYDDSTATAADLRRTHTARHRHGPPPRDRPGRRSPPPTRVDHHRRHAADRPRSTRPAPARTWSVGDVIAFSGHATDAAGRGAPGRRPHVVARSCSHCSALVPRAATRTRSSTSPAPSGSFTAPDHEYPSYLELKLTATDGAPERRRSRRRLDPQTVDLTFESQPAGLQLTVGQRGPGHARSRAR